VNFNRWLDRLLRRATAAENLIFCECNDSDCMALLPISDDVYMTSRALHPKAAHVLPGHEDDVDEVLERHTGYLVVQRK
jgi:hypothetical protein